MKDLPKQFAEFGEARQNGFLRVKDIKEKGGKVAGIFCTFTPTEILDAAGFSAVSLCGMSNETVADAEVDLPKNMCPLIKSSYGFAVSDKCPYTYFADLIVGETTCDGKKKMYELLGRMKEVYCMHLPQGVDQSYALKMWTEEMHRFIKYLEDNFDVKVTDEALRKAAKERNEERQVRLDLMELQKMTPPPMYGLDLYRTLEGVGFKFTHEEIMDSLNGLLNTVKEGYSPEKSPVSLKDKRILITGCPIGGVLDKTVKILEESGAVVACFENCSGIKAAYQMVDTEADDIVEAIADRYLQIGCSVMTPNNIRMEHIKKLIKEYQIDGVVEINLQGCHTYNIEANEIKKLVNEEGLLYLGLETDYSPSDSGQLSTRIEAFLEMM